LAEVCSRLLSRKTLQTITAFSGLCKPLQALLQAHHTIVSMVTIILTGPTPQQETGSTLLVFNGAVPEHLSARLKDGLSSELTRKFILILPPRLVQIFGFNQVNQFAQI
jgi:hypothetical protein